MGKDIQSAAARIIGDGEPGRTLSAAAVFFGLVELFGVGFSLAGGTISQSPALIILGLALGGAAGYYRWLPDRPGPGEPSPSGRFPRLLPFLAGLAVFAYASFWLLAYALPDFSYDGLWYHIPTLHFWALAGRVHWIVADLPSAWDPLIDNCLNGFPKGVELFTFVLVRATGLGRLANSVNLPFLPLGALGLAALSRTLGANRNFSFLVGALFILVPVNVGQAITSYVDTATAAVYIAAFALLAETLVRIRRGEIFWRGLPALGAAAGLAMGAKTPGIIFPPLFATVLAGVFLVPGLREIFPARRFFSRGLGFISVFLIIALLVGGYWPIRNFIRTGNPINPVGAEIAGRTIFPDRSWPGQFHSPYREGTEEWSQPRRVLSSWFFNFRDWWPRTTYGALEGGLGLLWIAGALPSLLVLAAATFFRRRRGGGGGGVVRHPAILAILLGVTALLFQLMPPAHNHLARYTIWVYAVGLPAFAVAGGIAWNARRRLRRLIGRVWVSGVIAISLLEGGAVWLYGLEMTSRYWPDWESPPPLAFRLRRSLTQPYPSGSGPGTLMDNLLSGRGATALGPLEERPALILGRLGEGEAFGKREIYFLDPEIAADAEQLRRYLLERDLRFVVWDERLATPQPLLGLALLREFAPGNFHLLAFNPRRFPDPGVLP